MKVVYGHTDSIYVQMPKHIATGTVDLLNNHVRQLFPNLLELDEHPVKLEFEKFYKTLGVGITKNRNAGLVEWKDGQTLDELEFVMTGFAAKRVAITPLAKKIQLTILKKWVNQTSEKEITTYLRNEYNKIIMGKIDVNHIINRSRYRPERLQYKCSECSREYGVSEAVALHKRFTSNVFCMKCSVDLKLQTLEGKQPSIGGGIEGVLWWNQTYDSDITDSYVYIRVADDSKRPSYINPVTGVSKRPTYIAAPNMNLLPKLRPDLQHYATSIVKKAEPIYKAMNWDTNPITNDLNQSQLSEWW